MTSTTEQTVLTKVPKGLFIGGEWRDATGGATIDVEDPATGQVLTSVADATVEDGRAALDAAVAAQSDWARTAPRDRAEMLRAAFGDDVVEHYHHAARWELAETDRVVTDFERERLLERA